MSERITWTHHMRGTCWLLIEHIGDVVGCSHATDVIALVTIDTRDDSATAEFAVVKTAEKAHRQHAIAAAARCYAQICDTFGDLLVDDDGGISELDDTAELLGCSGGSLGERHHEPTTLGATVRVHGYGAISALAVHFGYDFADAVMSK